MEWVEEIDTAGTGFKGRLVTHRRAMFWLVRRIHFDGMRGGKPMLRTIKDMVLNSLHL